MAAAWGAIMLQATNVWRAWFFAIYCTAYSIVPLRSWIGNQQINLDGDFHKRLFIFLQLKWLQNYPFSKLEVQKIAFTQTH